MVGRVITPDNRRQLLEASLTAALARSFHEPWIWGERDCALWSANVVRPVLGFDPMRPFRKRYRTALGYLRMLRNDGFASLDDAISHYARKYGWPRIGRDDAQVGDIGIVMVPEHPDGRSCVLHYKPSFWVGFRDRGHTYVPASFVQQAWSVL